jgi:outer membrane lipoprotein-sorting protein
VLKITKAILGGALALSTAAHGSASSTETATEILERTRAAYAVLTSYSDSGEVRIESAGPGAPAWEERHAFATHYRTPRNFRFDLSKKTGERVVVWCDGGDFQSWWSSTQTHTVYPKGRGHLSFGGASYATRGAVLLISPLIFPQAGLQGALSGLMVAPEIGLEGVEALGGRRVHRIVGDVGLGYARTGAVTAIRRTTVWIDVETYLVRQVLEDTPTSYSKGAVDRITTTFDPRANPALADEDFRFAAPEGTR